MTSTDWRFSIVDAFHAHFYIEDDPESRPGVEWVIEIARGPACVKVLVRGVFADDLGPKTRADHRYQAQTGIGFLADMIEDGWHPREGEQFLIEIHEPDEDDSPETGIPGNKLPRVAK